MGDCINVYNVLLSQDLCPCNRLCGSSDWEKSIHPWFWAGTVIGFGPREMSKCDPSRLEKCLHFGACLLTVPGTLLQCQQGWASPMSYMAPVTLFPQQTHQQLQTASVPSWDQPSQPRSMDFIKITKCSVMPKECKGCYGGLHTWPQLLPLHTSMLLQWDFVRAGVCGAWAKPEAIVQPNCWHTE